ncbi:MAG: thiamine phosphate synthase [Chloroflexi bacterium]|nr:thiamine phosphate synthase [Chloroflexota bacterium]
MTDRRLCPGQPLPTVVEQAVRGGVNVVQLRERDLPGGHLLALAQELREVTRGRALLLINERVDIALASEADGVQLGEEAMPVRAARSVAGDGLLLGRSVHSVEGARMAEAQGADFLIVGTIFPTRSKPQARPAGLGLLAQVARAVRLPFLAIGGITKEVVGQALAQGCAGIAVVSAILAASDVLRAAEELKEALAEASRRPVALEKPWSR